VIDCLEVVIESVLSDDYRVFRGGYRLFRGE